MNIHKIGIAEAALCNKPDKLRTAGLGSCVGVVLYDEMSGMSGMVHVMLPDIRIARDSNPNRWKYADTGVKDLYDALIKKGAMRTRMRAKIAGGAQMFQFQQNNGTVAIGTRNVMQVKEALKMCGIPLIAEHTGGNQGRTIQFDATTQLLHIRIVHGGELTL
ncbi:MAG: chemotaxis protein CheD [Bacilli bacterium]